MLTKITGRNWTLKELYKVFFLTINCCCKHLIGLLLYKVVNSLNLALLKGHSSLPYREASNCLRELISMTFKAFSRLGFPPTNFPLRMSAKDKHKRDLFSRPEGKLMSYFLCTWTKKENILVKSQNDLD